MFDVIHQWIRLNELMESFFKYQIRFGIGRKPINIQTNSEACILIKVQCVINQWIRFDKLYKLMVSFFFQISNSFPNYWPKTEKYSN